MSLAGLEHMSRLLYELDWPTSSLAPRGEVSLMPLASVSQNTTEEEHLRGGREPQGQRAKGLPRPFERAVLPHRAQSPRRPPPPMRACVGPKRVWLPTNTSASASEHEGGAPPSQALQHGPHSTYPSLAVLHDTRIEVESPVRARCACADERVCWGGIHGWLGGQPNPGSWGRAIPPGGVSRTATGCPGQSHVIQARIRADPCSLRTSSGRQALWESRLSELTTAREDASTKAAPQSSARSAHGHTVP